MGKRSAIPLEFVDNFQSPNPIPCDDEGIIVRRGLQRVLRLGDFLGQPIACSRQMVGGDVVCPDLGPERSGQFELNARR